MSEQKDKPQKQNGEPSLEEQLLALLKGLPSKPAQEEPPEEPPTPRSSEAGRAESAPLASETAALKDKAEPLPEIGIPQQSLDAPLVEELTILPGSQPTEQAMPKVGSPSSDALGSGGGHKEAPLELTQEVSSRPLAEEFASLFGKAPPAPGTTRPSPSPVVVHIPPASQGKEPPPIVSPVLEPVSGMEVPSTEAGAEVSFEHEVIAGPKPSRTFGGLNFLQKRLISLSIDGLNLRLLTMSGSSVETWASVPIPPQLFREGYIANTAGLGEAIEKTLKSQNINPGRLVCSFTSLGSISRILSLPQAARKDMANIVPRELRRGAVNPDNYSISWQILPSKIGPIQVYVIGVPKEPLLAFVEALRLAKLKPAVIELKLLALARAINQKDAIIAHGERDSLEMAIVVGAVPSLLRGIYLGSDTTPEQVAGRLTEELERTINFYNGTHRENPLDPQIPIYITGEIANYLKLTSNLLPTLGRNIAPLEHPLKLPEGFPLTTFMVNIGLVLRGYR